jgi:hypothetical protein
MKIEILNGSRVQHINGTVEDYMQGSRVYHLNGYTLNGYTLNAIEQMSDVDFEVLKAIVSGELDKDNMQGLSLAAIAGLAKKVVGGIKKGVQFVKGGIEKLRSGSDRVSEVLAAADNNNGSQKLDEFQTAVTNEFQNSEKGYLVGKSPFEPWKGKWWTDKNTPTMQKVGVGTALLVGIDALTGGNIILKKVGLMKGKKKK